MTTDTPHRDRNDDPQAIDRAKADIARMAEWLVEELDADWLTADALEQARRQMVDTLGALTGIGPQAVQIALDELRS